MIQYKLVPGILQQIIYNMQSKHISPCLVARLEKNIYDNEIIKTHDYTFVTIKQICYLLIHNLMQALKIL